MGRDGTLWSCVKRVPLMQVKAKEESTKKTVSPSNTLNLLSYLLIILRSPGFTQSDQY